MGDEGSMTASSVEAVETVIHAANPRQVRVDNRRLGRQSGLRRLAFTPCSGDPSTAFRVTSEPVPAVVGAAIKGIGSLSNVLPLPITSR